MRVYLKNLISTVLPRHIVKWMREVTNYLPKSWKYGKPYKEAVALLTQSETWDLKELLAYQQRQLRLLIDFAYSNVPYYTEVFQTHGLTPKDIQTPEDIQKLPFLTKEIVRERKADLMASNFSFFTRDEAHTSGSTGAALSFFMDHSTRAFERAIARRHLDWLGYNPGEPVAFFSPMPLALMRKGYVYIRPLKELRFSFGVVNPDRLDRMVKVLQEFKPAYISAWPSSLYILARWMERKKKSVPPPSFLIAGSENLYPHAKELIERVFQAPVIDHYGQEESVAVAIQCSLGQGYHIQMENSVVELVPHRDDLWELAGTCLHNFAMPFIRYRTGDLARKSDQPCPCGRSHPILSEIFGREVDFIVTPEGNLVSPLILSYVFHRSEEIRESQIIQEDLSSFRIKVVPWETISPATKEGLVRDFGKALESSRARMVIEEVEEIPPTLGCKRPFVISHIRPENRFWEESASRAR
ncbi:MAG: phenylacetate--CoA ligase family protein [Desulfomonile tiedjei]|nr:phenylacetate--CoA ligase family protein [Desulfomonile tiedjei]